MTTLPAIPALVLTALLAHAPALALTQPEIPRTPPALDALAPHLAPQRITDADTLRDISPQLQNIIAKSKTPGIVAAVLRDHQIIARGSAGLRAIGHDQAVTTSDLFHIGSCTKAFTADLCALLVESKQLRWDATLAELLPDHAADMRDDYQRVTLLDLLHHRSGIPADVSPSGLWAKCFAHPGPPEKSREELLPEVLQLKPVGTPGKSFLYSNFNYALAGHICERITKTPYETLLRERILSPLDITSAGFGAPGSKDSIDQPRGHRARQPVSPGSRLADNPPVIAPGGTMHLSITDWAKFADLHLAGARSNPTPILSPASFKVLHAPPASASGPGADYACAWIAAEQPWADGPALTHSGSNTMWYATIWLAPKKNCAILVAVNAGDQPAQTAVNDAVRTLIDIASEPAPTPTREHP